jgi:hypothetical protein
MTLLEINQEKVQSESQLIGANIFCGRKKLEVKK